MRKPWGILSVALIFASCGGHSSVLPSASSHSRTVHHNDVAIPTIPDTSDIVQPYQVFDWNITGSNATADASRYPFVWGDGGADWMGTLYGGLIANDWYSNGNMIVSYYFPIDGDLVQNSFGNLGHPLTWWQANHPTWILYKCDKTHLASIGLSSSVTIPLDPGNSGVQQYQADKVSSYMNITSILGTKNYNVSCSGLPCGAMAVDLITRNNSTGGCGYWSDGKGGPGATFTTEYTGNSGNDADPMWTTAMQNAVSNLVTDGHGESPPVVVFGNVGSAGTYDATMDTKYKTLIEPLDGMTEESQFTSFGNSRANDAVFNTLVDNATYFQTKSVPGAWLVDEKFTDNPVTLDDINWAWAGYLMGKAQASTLFITNTPSPSAPWAASGYDGYEHYLAEYNSANLTTGAACAGMTPVSGHMKLYYRKFAHSFALVNTSTTTSQTYDVSSVLGTSISNVQDLDGNTFSSSSWTLNQSTAQVVVTKAGFTMSC